MRILLDESLPIELRDELPQHAVRSVQEMGWSSLKNGELLRCNYTRSITTAIPCPTPMHIVHSA